MKISRNAVLCMISFLLVCTAWLSHPATEDEKTSLPTSATTETSETAAVETTA